MSRDARPWSTVSPALALLLAGALAAQLAVRAQQGRPQFGVSDLPPAPQPAALRLASLGETAAGARVAMLYVQAFDLRGDNAIPYGRLDYGRLVRWLDAILDADPRSNYPLFSAARIYAETPDPARARIALELVARAFPGDPNRRWAAMAHAALVAKHRLMDLPLARRYAAQIDRLVTDPSVPLWARQMEAFILEDMDELEAARVMLGGLIESGRVRDPGELRFLRERLGLIEERIEAERQRGPARQNLR